MKMRSKCNVTMRRKKKCRTVFLFKIELNVIWKTIIIEEKRREREGQGKKKREDLL
jgi:hypothetical protein